MLRLKDRAWREDKMLALVSEESETAVKTSCKDARPLRFRSC